MQRSRISRFGFCWATSSSQWPRRAKKVFTPQAAPQERLWSGSSRLPRWGDGDDALGLVVGQSSEDMGGSCRILGKRGGCGETEADSQHGSLDLARSAQPSV